MAQWLRTLAVGYACRGPRLGSHSTYLGAHSLCSSRPPSSGLCRHQTCIWHIDIQTGKTLIRIK
ncbi:hypothetical protein I79_009179 [Cricetulus griseus]|uniref:Uncharacterized protein n=1 Tax=Cricetulus griseus TaxID=10029 RepID=G3HF26_CRIGR|nr:hypothetical protein I79_009179 [Cricetulus griseus]